MPARWALIAAMGMTACSSRRPEAPAPAPAAAAPTGAPATPPPSIVGHWRLVGDETADDRPLWMGQEIREYAFAADHTYSLRSYHDNRDGTWSLDGDALALAGPAGGSTVTVVSLSARQLVLVEPVPAALIREGETAARSRNSFRRVSEAALGPPLGGAIATSTPAAGRYAATYAFHARKFPTTEMSIQTTIDGHAVLELAAGGAASGCLAVRQLRRSSLGRYQAPDRKDHTTEVDERLLLGARGTWSTAGGAVHVTLDRKLRGTCAPDGEGDTFPPSIELSCTLVAANDRLPVAALACELLDGPPELRRIAINPADSPRAGPYTLQSDPARHFELDPGRPWLLLGAAPGLRVESADDTPRDPPRLGFSAAPVDIDEPAFQRPPR